MRRVLVSGGAGFVGSHTVDRLLELGYEVLVLDSLRKPVHPHRRCPKHLDPRAKLWLGDVEHPSTWADVLPGCDAVIHLAAYQDYQPDFGAFFETNTVSTARLYEAIVARNFPVQKVVIASSQAVYGEGAYFCGGHGIVYPAPRSERQLQLQQWEPVCPHAGCQSNHFYAKTAELRVNPHNAYAISKHTQEQIGLTLGQRYGIPTTALRYSIVQGSRQSFHNAYSGILRRFTLQLLLGQTPTIYEDGRQMRDYVAIQDVVEANILALQDPRTDFEVFNVGGDRQVSVNAYYQLLAAKLGAQPHNEPSGLYRFGDTRHAVSSVAKLRALGWEPRVTLEEIVDGYLEWATMQPLPLDLVEKTDAVMRVTGVIRGQP